MRKTMDLPDDLTSDLETMSKKLNIPQTTLLAIGGYQLVSRYKTHGVALFDQQAKNSVTLIDSGVTNDNILYVQQHLSDFGNIRQVQVFGNQVPSKYRVPLTVGTSTYITEFHLILQDDRGKEWWFAGCSCGYGGEGVGGTHTILTLLGVPFSWERLAIAQHIDEMVESVDHSLVLSVTTFQENEPLVQFRITFRTAADRDQFTREMYWLGYASYRTSQEDNLHNKWANARNLELTLYNEDAPNELLGTWIQEILQHVVLGKFHGTIKELRP